MLLENSKYQDNVNREFKTSRYCYYGIQNLRIKSLEISTYQENIIRDFNISGVC